MDLFQRIQIIIKFILRILSDHKSDFKFQSLRNNNSGGSGGLNNMNLLEITAQDLLGKSHEELVLLLIHVR